VIFNFTLSLFISIVDRDAAVNGTKPNIILPASFMCIVLSTGAMKQARSSWGDNNFMSIPLKQFQEAGERLKKITKPTSLIYSEFLSEEYEADIYIKPENLQRTGSFKIRGAFNRIAGLSPEQRKHGIVTASAGNHAQGVALAAQLFCSMDSHCCARATIVMPETTPLIKVEATENLGAAVILHGDSYDEAYAEARRLEKEHGAVFVHPFNDLEVIIGQGTIGLEILAECPDADVVFVPVGGGGLLAGVAAAIKAVTPAVQVIGVEPDGAAGITESQRKGTLVELDHVDTIADGVAVKASGDLCLEIIQETADGMVTAPDTGIMQALLILMERQKLVAETAGALSVAALSHFDVKGKKVVCLVSGGNIDVLTLSEMINRGLISRGRLFSFTVELLHKPGELLKIAAVLASSKANIVKLDHDQFHNPSRFKSVLLGVTVETNGRLHVEQIVAALTDAGYKIR